MMKKIFGLFLACLFVISCTSGDAGISTTSSTDTATTTTTTTTLFPIVQEECVSREVIGIVAFSGAGLVPSPKIEGYSIISPEPTGPLTQEGLRIIAQNYYNAYNTYHLTNLLSFSSKRAGFYHFFRSATDFGGSVIVDESSGAIVFAGELWYGHYGGPIFLYPQIWLDGSRITYSASVPSASNPADFESFPSYWEAVVDYDQSQNAVLLSANQVAAFPADTLAILRKTDFLHSFAACGSYSIASYTYTPGLGLNFPELQVFSDSKVLASNARQIYLIRGKTTRQWQP